MLRDRLIAGGLFAAGLAVLAAFFGVIDSSGIAALLQARRSADQKAKRQLRKRACHWVRWGLIPVLRVSIEISMILVVDFERTRLTGISLINSRVTSKNLYQES